MAKKADARERISHDDLITSFVSAVRRRTSEPIPEHLRRIAMRNKLERMRDS